MVAPLKYASNSCSTAVKRHIMLTLIGPRFRFNVRAQNHHEPVRRHGTKRRTNLGNICTRTSNSYHMHTHISNCCRTAKNNDEIIQIFEPLLYASRWSTGSIRHNDNEPLR